MKNLPELKFYPNSAIFNNRNKINEIVDWINYNNKKEELLQNIIDGKLLWAKFKDSSFTTENDFYPIHKIVKRHNYIYVVWCNHMTVECKIDELEFRAIESAPFNPFNENSESLEKRGSDYKNLNSYDI